MPAAEPFDADLVRRYDRHGPRYTSYPTAAQFHSGFGVGDYRRAALLSNAEPAKPLSVYVHVPFCVSPCFYCGCNRVITRDRQLGIDYVRSLVTEIGLQASLFDLRRPMRQLHFGGGTPTFLAIEQLAQIVDALGGQFSLDNSPQREFSIEIDPRTVEPATLPGLAMLGFNRISFGVQDFDPRVQAAVNRRQSPERIDDCLRQARAAGFRSISVDLIYGLPLQTLASFGRTLDQMIAMSPDRIAAYGYAHLPSRFKAQRQLDERQLPNAELRLQLLALTVAKLTSAGYVHIGMDHFARPEDDLVRASRSGGLHRNFQGYSTGADCDLIGLGVSAIGSVGGTFSQNCKELSAYASTLGDNRLPIERGVALTMDDRIRANVIQRLMCQRSVCFGEIERAYAIDYASYFCDELRQLRQMQAEGLVDLGGDGFRVTAAGGFLLRNIAMVFDKYLAASAAAFSKAI